MKRLEINNLNSLLCLNNIIIRNEGWLLSRLLEWYKYKLMNDNAAVENKNEFKREFKFI